MGSTLKVRPPEAKTLIDKIKAEIKKRAELKAQRMLLKETEALAARLKLNSPKCLQSSGGCRNAKVYGFDIELLARIHRKGSSRALATTVGSVHLKTA